MKNAIVTGASGVIGRILVDKLIERGIAVVGIDIRSPHIVNSDKFQFVCHDLSQEVPFPYEMSVNSDTAIFHLAATFARTVEDDQYYKVSFRNNVVGTHNLLRMLDGAKFGKFIYASSYLVYDENQYLNAEHPVYLHEEKSKIKPRNIVGAAKYFAENEIEHWCGLRGLSFANARICRVYGGGGNEIISRMVRSSLRGEEIKVFDTEGMFDYIHAEDVAEGLIRITKTDFSGNVNLGFGSAGSVLDVIASVSRMNPETQFVNLGRTDLSIEKSCVDMQKFYYLTNWLPQITLEEGIQKTYEYESAKAA